MLNKRSGVLAALITAVVGGSLYLVHLRHQWGDDARLIAYKGASEKVREQLNILEKLGTGDRRSMPTVHYPGAIIDLTAGADRGTITFPLQHARVRASGQSVYFVLVESSDKEFAEAFGTMVSSALREVARAAVEDATFDPDQGWTFENDPGLVTRRDGNGVLAAPVSNRQYSPIKHVHWNGREIFVDAPFVKWGDAAGQQMLVDKGGCDPLIRASSPGAELIGGGPAGCERDPPGRGAARYRGGQLLALEIASECDGSRCGRATFKLQKAVHSRSLSPYITIFDASMIWTAEELGIPYVPRLGAAAKGYKATALLVDFANGTPTSGEGAYRFQPGVVSYGSREWSTYSPLVRAKCALVDCGVHDDVLDRDRNVSLGAVPKPGSRIERFDPNDARSFDPFGSFDKGIDCSSTVNMRVGPPPVYYEQLDKLVDDHAIAVTNTPCGWTGADLRGYQGDLDRDLLLNAPSSVTVSVE